MNLVIAGCDVRRLDHIGYSATPRVRTISISIEWVTGRSASVLTNSRIVTSIILWLKYAGLFFTTFTATISCVFMFWHFTTCPKVPWPRISRIRYLVESVLRGEQDKIPSATLTCDHHRCRASH